METTFWTNVIQAFSVVHCPVTGSHPSLVQCDTRPLKTVISISEPVVCVLLLDRQAQCIFSRAVGSVFSRQCPRGEKPLGSVMVLGICFQCLMLVEFI